LKNQVIRNTYDKAPVLNLKSIATEENSPKSQTTLENDGPAGDSGDYTFEKNQVEQKSQISDREMPKIELI